MRGELKITLHGGRVFVIFGGEPGLSDVFFFLLLVGTQTGRQVVDGEVTRVAAIIWKKNECSIKKHEKILFRVLNTQIKSFARLRNDRKKTHVN